MELSDNQVELEITALEKMNDLALAEKPSVQVAKIDSPIERVEEKLSDFVYECGILEAASREGGPFCKEPARPPWRSPARGPPGAPPGRGPLPRRPPARRMQHTAAFMGPADSASPG